MRLPSEFQSEAIIKLDSKTGRAFKHIPILIDYFNKSAFSVQVKSEAKNGTICGRGFCGTKRPP